MRVRVRKCHTKTMMSRNVCEDQRWTHRMCQIDSWIVREIRRHNPWSRCHHVRFRLIGWSYVSFRWSTEPQYRTQSVNDSLVCGLCRGLSLTGLKLITVSILFFPLSSLSQCCLSLEIFRSNLLCNITETNNVYEGPIFRCSICMKDQRVYPLSWLIRLNDPLY
jgi:hypothetical protein